MSFAQTVKQRIKQVLGMQPPAETKVRLPMTYPNVARFLYFQRMFQLIQDRDGDIVECGVGWGHSLFYLAVLAKEEMRGRKLWGFDSFEGFPEPTEADRSPRSPRKGEWKTSPVAVQNFLIDNGLDAHFVGTQVTLIKGFFDESLPKYRGEQIALLHLDGDLYESYRAPLNLLYERVVPGGVILFDEYLMTGQHYAFPGAAKAIDEFFGERKHDIKKDKWIGKFYYIKPA